jgi:hypothetical protein
MLAFTSRQLTFLVYHLKSTNRLFFCKTKVAFEPNFEVSKESFQILDSLLLLGSLPLCGLGINSCESVYARHGI